MSKPIAGDAHKRVQKVLAQKNVGGPRYSAEDALFDIQSIYIETFGPLPEIKENS
mgnify:CR=1 FL=1